jgi:hypothetical protein
LKENDAETGILESRPSGWSDWMRPDSTPIEVSQEFIYTDTDDVLPSIIFAFKRDKMSEDTFSRLLGINDTVDIYFSIQVRRKAKNNILNDDPKAWIDVGEPKFIQAGSLEASPVTILDRRVERSYPDNAETYDYAISLQQFFGTEAGIMQELIRKQKKVKIISVQVPAPRSDDKEMQVRVVLNIM